jgi:ubiquinone/menaquinone biosynthesis C-methylase UbiE
MAHHLVELHAPLVPILRHVLATIDLPRSGIALDLASGSGLKLPLLAEACGPSVQFIALDIDRDAVRIAWQAQSPRPTFTPPPRHRLVGDALTLPLRDACCETVFCIAALGLFADQRAALREMRRVLRPGGHSLIVTATQIWAHVIHYPADLLLRLREAYAVAVAEHRAPTYLAASPDMAGELSGLFTDAGFAAPPIRAFLLEDTAHPLDAELPLLPWHTLRPIVTSHLTPQDLTRCDQAAAESDVELCSFALTAHARV